MHAVIIGAGITGALTAHELLAAGAEVTILEAREKGSGSSSRSAACIRQQWSTPATVQAMRYAVRSFDRFLDEFHCGADVIPPVVHNGYLFLHREPDAWAAAKERVAMQQGAGLADVVALEPGALAERFPRVDASTLQGGTFCPSDGFLRPDVVYMEGFRRVLERGGRLEQNWRVTGGEHDATGRLVAVLGEDGRRCVGDVFINATNAWGARTSRLLGGTDLPIAPLKRYLYFVHRAAVDAAEMLQWPMMITPSRAYCRPENGDQLLAGWAHVAMPEPDFDWSDQDLIEPTFFHKTGLENYGYQLWMELAESVPSIGEFAGIQATTAGFYAVTPDHNPILGFDPRVGGLIHAAGFSGHGAMLGPFTARVVAAMAMAGRTLESVSIEDEEIDVRAMLVGREFDHAEGMVI